MSAEVRVSSVEQIVRRFGGPLLYGRDPSVPLRELIQNASDAVRARRALTADPLYEGKLVVSLKQADDQNDWLLAVEDDGIGMAEHILTGPLIEFGKSFWASEEAQDEFPGLVSARLHQAGRYGIGFFSTLMLTQRIEVTSRRWDAAQNQARKLTFRQGLRLRPLVSKTGATTLGQFSTRVALHITSENVERLLTVYRVQEDNLKLTLKELVAHLCPCVDCDVFILQSQDQYEIVHHRKWHELDALQWVRQIAFVDNRSDETIDHYLAKISPLIRVMTGPNSEPCGRAAIAFGLIETGIHSISGLVAAHHSRAISNFSMSFVGAIGFEPDGPRRDSGAWRNPAGVKAWASEQAVLLAKTKINEMERYIAAINIAEFDGDPTPIATILINRKPTSLSKVYNALAKRKEIFAAFSTAHGLSISTIHWQTPYYGLGLRSNEVDFSVLTMEAWSAARIPNPVYHKIPSAEDPTPSCFLSCLERYASSKGRTLKMEIVGNVLFATYKGESSPREKLSVGAELRGSAVNLSLM